MDKEFDFSMGRIVHLAVDLNGLTNGHTYTLGLSRSAQPLTRISNH